MSLLGAEPTFCGAFDMFPGGEPKLITDGQIQSTGTSFSPDLTMDTGIVDEQKRTFWCFIVGKQADGALRIVSPNQPTCLELIRRGVGSRQLN